MRGWLPLACIAKRFSLVCYAARDVVLEGLYELGAQLQQLLLEQLPHHDCQLALQLLAFGLPDSGLKVAGLLVIACIQCYEANLQHLKILD